jgi:hypothetical protein
VDHKADVRLVDAQAEGVGGHRGPQPVVHEQVLGEGALPAVHPAVVAVHPHTLLLQADGQFLDRLDCRGVDDAGPLAVAQEVEQPEPFLGVAGHRDHTQFQVGPVESGVDHVGVGDVQQGADVVDHVGGGGGRQGQHRRAAQILDGVAQEEVVGAKVVAPLADAVGLVHHEQLDRLAAEQRAELRPGQPFRGGVDELHRAGANAGLGLALLAGRQRAVEHRHAEATLLQAVGLVLHQGDQRTDHQGHSLQFQGRQLET